MKLAGVLKQIGPIFAVLAVISGMCALHAVAAGDSGALIGLALCCLIAGVVWAVLALMLADIPPVSDLRSKLAIVAMFWLVVPLLAALPFVTSLADHSWLIAIFEAVSNLTTSGASADATWIPSPTIRLWRALLQWLGGAASVAMAVAIFSDLSSSAAGLLRAHRRFPVGPCLLQRAAWRIGAVYLASAVTASLILIANGADPIIAFEMAMAAITTSYPASDIESLTGGVLSSLVLVLTLIVGAANIGLLWSAMTPIGGIWRDTELRLMLVLIGVIWLGACWMAGSFDLALIGQTVSFMTGSGMDLTSARPLISILPAPVPECLALAGGAALSTTGGLKLIRLKWLSTLMRDEFSVLAVEHSVDTAPRTTKNANDRALIYMIAYLLVIPVLLIGLCLTGASVPIALRGAIGTLTSHGPLVAEYLTNDAGVVSLCLLGLGGIAGRVELLALVPILGMIRWRIS